MSFPNKSGTLFISWPLLKEWFKWHHNPSFNAIKVRFYINVRCIKMQSYNEGDRDIARAELPLTKNKKKIWYSYDWNQQDLYSVCIHKFIFFIKISLQGISTVGRKAKWSNITGLKFMRTGDRLERLTWSFENVYISKIEEEQV